MSRVYRLSQLFLIKLAQDPKADELLKKRLGPEERQDPILMELIDRGIIPIVANRVDSSGRSEETAFLGEGADNKVYEVSYKGKLAVAKVTTTRKDYDIMTGLSELKAQLGADGKHIVNIYTHFELGGDEDYGGPSTYVMVVEKLNPLSPHLVQAMFDDWGSGKFQAAKQQISYAELAEKMSQYIKTRHRFKFFDSRLQTSILEKLTVALRKVLLQATRPNELRLLWRQGVEELANWFRRELESQKNLPGDINKQENIIREILNEVGYDIGNFLPISQVFPTFHYQSNDDNATVKHFLESPETKDFMRLLLRLKKDFGYGWGDLHQANIMVRPGTGDLVISDPGRFTEPIH